MFLQTWFDWGVSEDGKTVETTIMHKAEFFEDRQYKEKQVFQYYTCIEAPSPICFVTIGYISEYLKSITANIYNLKQKSAVSDGPDSITIFPTEAELAVYYYYNDKVGKDEPCDATNCPYSVITDEVDMFG